MFVTLEQAKRALSANYRIWNPAHGIPHDFLALTPEPSIVFYHWENGGKTLCGGPGCLSCSQGHLRRVDCFFLGCHCEKKRIYLVSIKSSGMDRLSVLFEPDFKGFQGALLRIGRKAPDSRSAVTIEHAGHMSCPPAIVRQRADQELAILGTFGRARKNGHPTDYTGQTDTE